MASLYVEVHQSLADHPKTKKALRLLGISKPQFIGHMVCLWWWCQVYAKDGDLSHYDNIDIADGAEWDGDPDQFVNALLKCGTKTSGGFMVRDGGDLFINDWHEYGGKIFKEREKGAERQRNWRERQRNQDQDAMSPLRDDNVTVTLSDITRLDRDRESYRDRESDSEQSPASPVPNGTPTIPVSLEGWREELREAKNKGAALMSMFDTLFPQAVDRPDFAYIGRTAKVVGGAGRLAELMWQAAARPPTGDIMAYCIGMAKGSKTNGKHDPAKDDIREAWAEVTEWAAMESPLAKASAEYLQQYAEADA